MGDELERFNDPSWPAFEGYPTTRVTARHRWAHAFRVYVAEVADFVGPGAITPVQATLAAGFPGPVEQGFFEQLRLDPGVRPRPAAEDFADAWRAGMQAVRSGTGGSVPPSTTITWFVAWQPGAAPGRTVVDDRRDLLADDLTALFSRPAFAVRPRLEEIAQAFHRATVEISAVSNVGSTILTYR